MEQFNRTPETPDPTGADHLDHAAASVDNTIIWGNTNHRATGESAQIHSSDDSTVEINYSLVEEWTGKLGGTGNFGGDPSFVQAAGPDNVPGMQDDNLRLLPGSPAIDAGDAGALPRDLTAAQPSLPDDWATRSGQASRGLAEV